MKKKLSIWWAIDPFHDDINFYTAELKYLFAQAKILKAVIQPIAYIDTYRVTENSGNIFPLFPLYHANPDELIKVASERTKPLYKKASSSTLKPIIYLINKSDQVPSLSEKINEIEKYAKRHKASLIALRTHSHKGIKRFYLGSFTETFILQTELPTLVIPSTYKSFATWSNVVFATDFSAESKKAFLKILPIIAQSKCKLKIVNILPGITSLNLISSDLNIRYKERLNKSNALGQQFIKLAKKHKISALYDSISLTRGQSFSDALHTFSKTNKADLIALAARSSGLKTAIIGSLTRSLIRSSEIPILIQRQ